MTLDTRQPDLLVPLMVGETDVLTFDYTDSLVSGETISSADVAITVAQGVYATPSDLKSGAAQAASPYVLQKVAASSLHAGKTYLCVGTATTSQARVLIKTGLLPVVPVG